MRVNFAISERRLLQLQRELGSVAQDFPRDPRFTLVLADGSEYARKAALDFVDPAVDRQTGTLAVRLSVPNPEQPASGQFVRVIVPAAQIPDALLLPQRAVQERQGRPSCTSWPMATRPRSAPWRWACGSAATGWSSQG